MMLALTANFQSPLLWGIMIGWIMTVVLHEFAHGIVAYWGGDYTIAERGGLTLNPLQYINPVNSIILPLIWLMLGGIPLPGGATYIRRDLLRSKAWNTAVSLAGPAVNLMVFLLLCVAIHPKVKWIDNTIPVAQWSTAQQFCAAMAFLQMFAVLLNLVPIPPMDGYKAISPYLPVPMQIWLSRPQVANTIYILYFVALMQSVIISGFFIRIIIKTFVLIGIDPNDCFDAFDLMYK